MEDVGRTLLCFHNFHGGKYATFSGEDYGAQGRIQDFATGGGARCILDHLRCAVCPLYP